MQAAELPVWGILDVGSNTFRLCVYRLEPGGGYEELASVKAAVGLASYLTPSGELSQEGIDKAGKELAKLARMASLMQCDELCIFATAAVRNCSNSADALVQLERACWHPIQVISGREEAQLSLMGAMESATVRDGLFFDIGGGSTELISLEGGAAAGGESIPLGSLNAWMRCCEQILPKEHELKQLAREVGALLDASRVELPQHCEALCSGGTMRFALKMARKLGSAELELIFNTLRSEPNLLAHYMLQINPARVHTLLPGITIGREILHRLGCDSVVVAKTGVREGYLRRKIDAEHPIASL